MEMQYDIKEELAKKYKVNSDIWWNEYFKEGLWANFDGGGQTLFFGKIAIEHLEPQLKEKIKRNKWSIIDVGCAEGETTNLLAENFSDSKVIGVDLSEHAINNAQKKHPSCDFRNVNLKEIKEKCDVIFSSNVLEHLENPAEEIQSLFDLASKYMIILVPVNDETGEASHINKFTKEFFVENCPEGGSIFQMKIIDTSGMEHTYWPGEQLLIVYERRQVVRTVDNYELITKPETWDAVAETYDVELEDGDLQLANDIERILKQHGLQKGDSLIEMGCGSGHLSVCLAQKGYKVFLVDFSPVALEKAKMTFKRYGVEGEFILGDLFHLDESIPVCDFAWNSGVMEHFGDKEIITLMQNIGRHTKRGVLYLVPNSSSIAYLLMRARLMADDEWIYGEEYLRRDYGSILRMLGYANVEKSFVSTAAISAYQIWKAEKEQGNISELYRKLTDEKMLPAQEGYLVSYYASNMEDKVLEEKYIGSTVQDTRVFDLVAKKIGYGEQKELVKRLKVEKQQLEQEKEDVEKNLEELMRKLGDLERQKEGVEQEIDNLIRENQQKIEKFEEKENEYVKKIEFQENLMFLAKNECFRYNSRTIYKIFRALLRFRDQFMRGNKQDRKDFWALFRANISKKKIVGTRTDGFNPMYNIINILDGVEYGGKSSIGQWVHKEDDKAESTKEQLTENLSITAKGMLKRKYEKTDIIIFSVISYDFRYQRPQHFASRFAVNGHRVFYINANFNGKDQVKEISNNLFTVDFSSKLFNAIYETDWSQDIMQLTENLDSLIQEYAMTDAIVIVDYPNWIHGANYLKNKYGFITITDYMDDFTGFLGTTTNILKDNCIKLLKECDLVVASSQFLYDIAVKYAKKVEIVRNGSEVEHFYKALEMEYHKERKVIGYYGAVAHWFAWEKVCYLAEHLPECDIVIIGEITEHRGKLEKYPNIKLLGEMPYAKLPEHLAYFDVCLIPFDTSTDLIKATNPVKFYEYLSAGKRVVATEIPELEPFRNEYVYMSNDDARFLEYVKMCLEGKDSLRNKEECVAFANENDWQRRFEYFAKSCFERIPKVSIIVLTYNNLELNKRCIRSILENTAYPNYELIIVDNHSTDGTVEYLREVEEWRDIRVKVIFNEENAGFAGGNNIGIQKASGDYIMLLNNDTVVTRGWLTNMIKHLKRDTKYGMCGAVTNSIGNEAKIRVDYKNYDELMEFAFAYTQMHMGEEYSHVDRLAMFCTLIPREVIDKCGLLDERYLVGMFEDDDYAQAVKSQGRELVIAEDAFVHHVDSASFKKLDEKKYNEIFEMNKRLFEDKWNVKWTYPKYRDGVDVCNNGRI